MFFDKETKALFDEYRKEFRELGSIGKMKFLTGIATSLPFCIGWIVTIEVSMHVLHIMQRRHEKRNTS